MQVYTFCSFCGTRFPADADWQRHCPACQNTTHRNPLLVAGALLPVADGRLLLIRRAIAPQAGKPALPGVYVKSPL